MTAFVRAGRGVYALAFLICLTTGGHALTNNVRDFGALGDGRHDDGPSIQAAVDAAVHQGSGNEVQIPAGRYLLGDFSGSPYQIVLKHVAGLTIAGEPGTTLVSAPGKTFFAIQDASDVVVRSLTLDRDPLAYSQATVRAVDVARHTARVMVNAGYADFSSEIIAGAKFFVVFHDPQAGSWGEHLDSCAWFNPKDPSVCWPPSITGHQRLSETEWEVRLDTAPSEHDVGKTVSLWNLTYKGHAFGITASHNIVVEDVRYYPGGADGAFVLSQNSGTITFRRLVVDVRPGSDQLISGIGGAMVFNNHARLNLEQVKVARVWDDAINIGANYARVASHPKPRQIEVDRRKANDWRVGDTVALWDWVSKSERDRYHVIAVDCHPKTPDLCLLTLDRDPDIHSVGLLPIKSRDNDTDQIDRVISMESAGILHATNSSFQSLHARGLLIHSSNSLIEQCEFYDTVLAGIVIGPEFFWDEGPVVNNLTIRDSIFRNVSGSNIIVESANSNALENREIHIINNRFTGFGRYHHGIMGEAGVPILIHNVDRATVSGNSFDQPFRGSMIKAVKSEGSASVMIQSN